MDKLRYETVEQHTSVKMNEPELHTSATTKQILKGELQKNMSINIFYVNLQNIQHYMLFMAMDLCNKSMTWKATHPNS